MAGNWSLQVNVAGVQPFEPGGTRLPQGAYAVQILDVDLKSNDPSKPASLNVKFKVAEEGDFKGIEGMAFVSTDFTKDFHKKNMRALLLGMGASVQALDNGTLTLSPDMFVNKPAFLYVETRDGQDDNGKKLYDNRNFIAPAYYEKWKAENKGAAAKPAGATAGTNGTATAQSGLGALAGAGAAQPTGAFGGGAIFGKQ